MTTTETWPTPQALIHDDRGDRQLAVLAETRDYTRRIHWWIRLAGVVWLTSIAVGVLAFLGIVALGNNVANKFDDVNKNLGTSSYSSRSQCMAAVETTIAQCNALFPN